MHFHFCLVHAILKADQCGLFRDSSQLIHYHRVFLNFLRFYSQKDCYWIDICLPWRNSHRSDCRIHARKQRPAYPVLYRWPQTSSLDVCLYLNAIQRSALLGIQPKSLPHSQTPDHILPTTAMPSPNINLPTPSNFTSGKAGEITQSTRKTNSGTKTNITSAKIPAKTHLCVSTITANQAANLASPEPKAAGEESDDWKSWH